MLADTFRGCALRCLHVLAEWHGRPHTMAHHYGVKGAVTVLVMITLLAPEPIRIPLAVTANMIWIWIDP